MEKLYVVYNGVRNEVPQGVTSEQVREFYSTVFPELVNAEVKRVGNEIQFEIHAGTKGLRVVYDGVEINVDDHYTNDEVKASMSQVFPELVNAEVKRVGNEIQFEIHAGTKGNE